ncbi:unnamed protein product [Rotaria magnacalcarata]|uniref:NAD(P)(+)--arginine ADP-ribosyltransferase n=1 Tax=Rotaria magnacalcarata TaxID=392030 RepID=A0A816SK63_9BILA|nr:unnamed protein product [Rotaria magnacalcarata]CAF4844181.1 unnamed protein product [Rotaria magnacalcarata]
MNHSEQQIKPFIELLRSEYSNNAHKLKDVAQFERDYRPESAVWWYTREPFIYQKLNWALRTLDAPIILKLSFILCDLHRQIETLHQKQVNRNEAKIKLYRGQVLLRVDFEKLQKNKGGLLSFNNFLSTTSDLDVSLAFAKSASVNPDTVGVLFQMSIDTRITTTLFASIREFSEFIDENEILFSMHTVFRIVDVFKVERDHPLYNVNLELTSEDDPSLTKLREHFTKKAEDEPGWTRLARLLLQLDHFDEAEQLCNDLLQQHKASIVTKASLYNIIGLSKAERGELDVALSFYHKILEIFRITLSKDDSSFGALYLNIGTVYERMGNYAKSIEFYNKSIRIFEKALPEIHPDLSTCYNRIGHWHQTMGDYSKALEFHDKALKLAQKLLPKNHPTLAASYGRIALLYVKSC